MKKEMVDASTRVDRKVVSMDRADGAKFCFDDDLWMPLLLSGTEPLLWISVEEDSAAAPAKWTRNATD